MSNVLRMWLVVVAVAMGVGLGSVPLFDADEGRNAEVAREMAATNDYVMPRLNGLPYLDKPVIYFAAAAAFMEVLGPTELAARLPAWLFTLFTAALIFWFARRVWGGDTPLIAAIVFLATPLTIAFARTVIFDSALTFFTTMALLSFYLAVDERNPRWSLLAWLAMGFAMITKGPVAFILVLAVALPWAWRRKGMSLLFPAAGLIAFALVVAPWVWGVSQVVPEFLRYVLVTETAERMATGALKRTGPPWYFIPYLAAGAMPWIFVALFSAKKLRRPDPVTLYLLLSLAIPFFFFSISQSKRPQYIVPLMPALALVVARIWEEARTRAASMLTAAFGVLLIAASFFAGRTKLEPALQTVAARTALLLGVAVAAGGLLAFFARRRDLVLIGLTLPVIALPLVSTPLLQTISERRSAKGFVEELRPHVTPQTEVIGVEAFSGSMAFYLGQPITLVTPNASELTSNYLMRRYDAFVDGSSAMRPMSYFQRSLASNGPRVYVVRRKDPEHRQPLEARGWRVVADSPHHLGYAAPAH